MKRKFNLELSRPSSNPPTCVLFKSLQFTSQITSTAKKKIKNLFLLQTSPQYPIQDEIYRPVLPWVLASNCSCPRRRRLGPECPDCDHPTRQRSFWSQRQQMHPRQRQKVPRQLFLGQHRTLTIRGTLRHERPARRFQAEHSLHHRMFPRWFGIQRQKDLAVLRTRTGCELAGCYCLMWREEVVKEKRRHHLLTNIVNFSKNLMSI